MNVCNLLDFKFYVVYGLVLPDIAVDPAVKSKDNGIWGATDKYLE